MAFLFARPLRNPNFLSFVVCWTLKITCPVFLSSVINSILVGASFSPSIIPLDVESSLYLNVLINDYFLILDLIAIICSSPYQSSITWSGSIFFTLYPTIFSPSSMNINRLLFFDVSGFSINAFLMPPIIIMPLRLIFFGGSLGFCSSAGFGGGGSSLAVFVSAEVCGTHAVRAGENGLLESIDSY